MLGNEVMTKEQLFDLFQQVLNIKKFEHQLLYNAMQVRMNNLYYRDLNKEKITVNKFAID